MPRAAPYLALLALLLIGLIIALLPLLQQSS